MYRLDEPNTTPKVPDSILFIGIDVKLAFRHGGNNDHLLGASILKMVPLFSLSSGQKSVAGACLPIE